MQVSVETTGSLERKMNVKLPADKVESEVEKRINSLKGKVKIDGFRPGKVPVSLIKKRYGGQVRSEVMTELLQSSYSEALQSEKLIPAGMPEIQPKELQEGEGMEYDAIFEVYPEFEVAPFDTIKITKPKVEVTDADIDRLIDDLRRQRAKWNEVDRQSQDGDKVKVDFKGLIEGEEFEGNKAEDFELIIGSKNMLKEFEDGVVGCSAGDEVNVAVNFPEDYHSADIAGKVGNFDIKIKAVLEAEMPEVDDEFAKALGVKDETAEGLRNEIKINLERERDQAILSRVKMQVLKGLEKDNQFDLPKALVDQEIEKMQDQLKQQGVQDLSEEEFEKQGKTRVTLALVIRKIIDDNEIKLDESKVKAMIERVASTYGDPSIIMQYYQQNPEMMQNFEASVLEEQVIEFVSEKADVNEVEMSFEDLANAPVSEDEE